MPAGDTRETLIEMYPLVFELCAEHGYNMTGRDHIIAYDTKETSLIIIIYKLEEGGTRMCPLFNIYRV
jgi:hypothetical protein